MEFLNDLAHSKIQRKFMSIEHLSWLDRPLSAFSPSACSCFTQVAVKFQNKTPCECKVPPGEFFSVTLKSDLSNPSVSGTEKGNSSPLHPVPVQLCNAVSWREREIPTKCYWLWLCLNCVSELSLLICKRRILSCPNREGGKQVTVPVT